MKNLIAILFCFVSYGLFAQELPDHKSLRHAMKDFDRALISRDSTALKWLLEDQVTYGHSNGWIETKKDVIADLFNGKLVYKEIKPTGQEIVIVGKTASARYNVDIDVLMDGKLMQFKLKVLQSWIWENEHWVLFARQSVKI